MRVKDYAGYFRNQTWKWFFTFVHIPLARIQSQGQTNSKGSWEMWRNMWIRKITNNLCTDRKDSPAFMLENLTFLQGTCILVDQIWLRTLLGSLEALFNSLSMVVMNKYNINKYYIIVIVFSKIFELLPKTILKMGLTRKQAHSVDYSCVHLIRPQINIFHNVAPR